MGIRYTSNDEKTTEKKHETMKQSMVKLYYIVMNLYAMPWCYR